MNRSASTEVGVSIAIISGGTATNELVGMFQAISSRVSYVLPISDNGGSTSELIRVIGGPAIGDIRSRLTRLIPEEQESLRRLLSYRLSADSREAREQWDEIVEGTHEIWRDISAATKEIFRAFFIHLHVELMKRSKHSFSLSNSKRHFRYELASVGNMFLTGIRLFIGSLDSAIELFMKLTGVDSRTEVIPCINTNFTYHISALLENGLVITGQSQISHPSPSNAMGDNYPPPINKTPVVSTDSLPESDYFDANDLSKSLADFSTADASKVSSDIKDATKTQIHEESDEESGNVPQYTHPELKKSQLHFDKSEHMVPLLSPIKRIFYISPYGEEICPTAHGRVVSSLTKADTIVYSIGSLMTSIVPVIILKGIGKAIAADYVNEGAKKKNRILLLNGTYDRETFGMSASDFINTIVRSVLYSLGEAKNKDLIEDIGTTVEWSRFVSHLFYMAEPKIEVDKDLLERKNIECVEVRKVPGKEMFDLEDLEAKLRQVILK